MAKRLTTLLTIAGSDSSGGAGIQADIKAADLCHVHAMTAITAITAQSTSAINGILTVPTNFVESQLYSAIEDQIPDAVKIGMIASVENGEVIADFIENTIPGIPVVIDPVVSATSGKDLSRSKKDAIRFYTQRLIPLATLVTPNLNEAACFLGLPENEFENYNSEELKATALSLLKLFKCKGVILKGGHTATDRITDIAAIRQTDDNCEFNIFSSPKIECVNLHGTGCTLSTLMACEMAKGASSMEAFLTAERSINKIITASQGYIYGHSNNGVLNVNNYKLKTI